MHPEQKDSRRLWPYGVILVMLGIELAVSLNWLSRVLFPFGSFHLSWSYTYAETLRDQGLASMLARWKLDDYYPPLLVTVWAFVHRIFGISRHSIPIASAVWWIPGLFAVYALGRRATGGPWAGLLACALTLVAPHIAFYFRVPSYEVPMAAMQMVMLWGIVASERFYKPWPLLAAAAAFGAGMLMKWTFIAGAFGIAAFAAADTINFGVRRLRLNIGPILTGKQIAHAAAFAVLAPALAAPWYLFMLSWDKIATNFPTDPTPGGLVTQASWYLIALFTKLLSIPISAAFLACTPLLFFGKSKQVPAALAMTFTATYAVLCTIPHKELRYGAVLIPLCTLIIAVGLANLTARFGRTRAVAAFAGIALLGAGAFNVADMSARNVFPLESGDLDEAPLPCTNDMDLIMSSLVKHIDDLADRRLLRVAIHPLSTMSISFSGDAMAYYLQLHSVKQKRRIEMIGFANFYYSTFDQHYDKADLLLVPDEVWDLTAADLEKRMKDLTDYLHPGEDAPPVPAADPLYKERINAVYEEIAQIPAKCVKTVHVFRKRVGSS